MAGTQSKQKVTYWRKVVDNLNESNLSANEFAKKHRISSQKLSYWKSKFANDSQDHNDFIEVKETTSTDDCITLSINNVITLKFSSAPSPKWISELLSRVQEVA